MLSHARKHLLILGLAAVPLVRFVIDARRGIEYLLHQFLVDDAFYYFVIARHFPYFNEGIPTSGFHPLYAILLVPFHSLLAPDTAIYASLLLLVIGYSLSTVALYFLLARLWRPPIPILCTVLWVASPMLYHLAMTGVETILAVLMVLVFYLQALKFRAQIPEGLPASDAAALGALAGVAFLARMDSPLFLAPGIIWVIYVLLRERSWRGLAAFAAPMAGIVGAWIGYITLITGHPFPTSGAALRIIQGVEHQAVIPVQMAKGAAFAMIDRLVDFVVYGLDKPVERIIMVVVTAVAIFGAWALPRTKMSDGAREVGLLSGLVLAGTMIWASYYILHQGMVRSWYLTYLAISIFAVISPLVFNALFLAVGRADEPKTARRLWVFALLVVAAGTALTRSGPWAPQEYEKHRAALVADQILRDVPEDVRVGSFNTGVYNFFMQRDVINLDGVVNPEVHEPIRSNTLAAYLKSRNIRYLIDHEGGASMQNIEADPTIRLEEVTDLTERYPPWGDEHVRRTFLWKLHFDDDADTGSDQGASSPQR